MDRSLTDVKISFKEVRTTSERKLHITSHKTTTKNKVITLEMYCFSSIFPNHLLYIKTTKKMAEDFQEELSIFFESFNMHGPGAVGNDLDQGI